VATILLGAALLVGCSALVGQAICALAGRERWAWWAPAVGFAALLTIGGVLIRAPGHSKSVAFAIAVLTIGSLAAGPVRAAFITAIPDGLPVAVVTLLATMLPFAMWGRAGIIGAGVNNDMGAHLGTAWWLQHKRGPAPVGALGGGLANVGYPIGPHGLADALSLNKISLVHTFDAVIVCVPALIALTALGALTWGPRVVRWIVAVLVGVCYLIAAFTVQSSFKETTEALLVVAVVLATRDALADREMTDPTRLLRAGVPIGVLIGGSVWVYSFGGLPWTLGAAIAVALVSGPLRRLLPVAGGAAIAASSTSRSRPSTTSPATATSSTRSTRSKGSASG
jgi:hypothetical protein